MGARWHGGGKCHCHCHCHFMLPFAVQEDEIVGDDKAAESKPSGKTTDRILLVPRREIRWEGATGLPPPSRTTTEIGGLGSCHYAA